MPTLSNEIFRARLNYQAVEERNPSWDNLMINDYLGIGQGSSLIIEQVDINSLNIETNSDDIDDLEVRVTSNEDSITNIGDELNIHVNSDTQHGVNGVNVGTEDFCTKLIGGVVNLMSIVADANLSSAEVTLADLGVAPAVYDPIYAQQQSDLINDIKSKHNQLLLDFNVSVDRLNEMISNAKSAKQMSSV